MGFGKWILGGLGIAGAIIAAPVVLPMAAAGAAAAGAAAVAAGGAVAAGAATAAGAVAAGATAVGGAVAAAAGTVATAASAVAAGATAAGGAAVGAATAAGGALASTAVGGAVVSSAAAVGGVVGSAAGAVGLTSVATVAGTATGAAAVGTIATTGTVAVASSAAGIKNLVEAKEIVEHAEYRYNLKKADVDKREENTKKSLVSLGELKLHVWESFKVFFDIVSQIKNCKLLEGSLSEEDISISKDELDKLEELSISAIDMLKLGPTSLGVGALTGVAAYGGTMAIGTASTGTAIASLSGAAATNAAMAALGGGSLASGGLGMAGGATVLGGLVAAPALAVSGLFFAAKASNRKKEAEDVAAKSEKAITKMEEAISLLGEIANATDKMYTEIKILFKSYSQILNVLSEIVAVKTDFKKFSKQERVILEKSIIITKILKNLTTTNVIVTKNSQQTANSKEIDMAIAGSVDVRKKFA